MAQVDDTKSDLIYSWITGSLLSSFVSQPVTLFAQFMSIEGGGKFMKIRLTDDSVIMATPVPTGAETFDRDSWLYIRAIVENRNKIKLVSVYKFPETMSAKFNKSNYNEAVSTMIELGSGYLTIDKKDLFEHFGTSDPGNDGANADLISIDSAGSAAGNPPGNNPNNSTIGGEMQFDEFNGSNLW